MNDRRVHDRRGKDGHRRGKDGHRRGKNGHRSRSGDRLHDGRRRDHDRRVDRRHGVHRGLAGEHCAQPGEGGLGRLQERKMTVGHRPLVSGVRVRRLTLRFLVRLDPCDVDLGNLRRCAGDGCDRCCRGSCDRCGGWCMHDGARRIRRRQILRASGGRIRLAIVDS